jgi:hypothetical protein
VSYDCIDDIYNYVRSLGRVKWLHLELQTMTVGQALYAPTPAEAALLLLPLSCSFLSTAMSTNYSLYAVPATVRATAPFPVLVPSLTPHRSPPSGVSLSWPTGTLRL